MDLEQRLRQIATANAEAARIARETEEAEALVRRQREEEQAQQEREKNLTDQIAATDAQIAETETLLAQLEGANEAAQKNLDASKELLAVQKPDDKEIEGLLEKLHEDEEVGPVLKAEGIITKEDLLANEDFQDTNQVKTYQLQAEAYQQSQNDLAVNKIPFKANIQERSTVKDAVRTALQEDYPEIGRTYGELHDGLQKRLESLRVKRQELFEQTPEGIEAKQVEIKERIEKRITEKFPRLYSYFSTYQTGGGKKFDATTLAEDVTSLEADLVAELGGMVDEAEIKRRVRERTAELISNHNETEFFQKNPHAKVEKNIRDEIESFVNSGTIPAFREAAGLVAEKQQEIWDKINDFFGGEEVVSADLKRWINEHLFKSASVLNAGSILQKDRNHYLSKDTDPAKFLNDSLRDIYAGSYSSSDRYEDVVLQAKKGKRTIYDPKRLLKISELQLQWYEEVLQALSQAEVEIARRKETGEVVLEEDETNAFLLPATNLRNASSKYSALTESLGNSRGLGWSLFVERDISNSTDRLPDKFSDLQKRIEANETQIKVESMRDIRGLNEAITLKEAKTAFESYRNENRAVIETVEKKRRNSEVLRVIVSELTPLQNVFSSATTFESVSEYGFDVNGTQKKRMSLDTELGERKEELRTLEASVYELTRQEIRFDLLGKKKKERDDAVASLGRNVVIKKSQITDAEQALRDHVQKNKAELRALATIAGKVNRSNLEFTFEVGMTMGQIVEGIRRLQQENSITAEEQAITDRYNFLQKQADPGRF